MSPSQITIAPVLPWGVILLLFGFAAAAALAQYVKVREKLGRRRAAMLALLRLAALALIVAFALNPSLVSRTAHTIPPAIAIVIDTARSMGQPAAEAGASRLERAKGLLTEGAEPLLRSLGENYAVSLYGLADSLRPLEAGDLEGLQAFGPPGDAGQALQALAGKHAVAVLLSDGNLGWNPDAAAPRLPVIAVPLGNPQTYRDVLIAAIKAPALAFRDREVVIDVTLKSYGYAGATLPVLLQDPATLLTAAHVRVQGDSDELTASLAFTPKAVGRQHLTITVPQQAGESLAANNRRALSINVVPDKTRILMVSGSPSMNYRFMRAALKRDPSIDLLSFVILRSPSDILNVRPYEQSLIPFPVDTLFNKELNGFDLVIFDNFNYALYLRPDHLENLRNYVKGGGAFAMLGGPNLFAEGRYGLSPIGEILPFRFIENDFYRGDVPTPVKLSAAGTRHALLRIADSLRADDAEQRRFWEALPPLDGINLVEAKRSATVLLESTDGIPWPVLTVSDYERGRVLALTTDSAWKWYMGLVARGEGTQPYLRLVHRMVRWLVKDPGLDPVRIVLPQTAVADGREVDVGIVFQAQDASPGPDAAVQVAVTDPEGARIESNLEPTPRPEEFRLSFRPGKGGVYQVQVETPFGPLAAPLAVADPQERLNAAPDPDRLRAIADGTGGKIVSGAKDLRQAIDAVARKAEKVFVEERRRPLWATPAMLAVVLALLGAEWYYRRRWGLM